MDYKKLHENTVMQCERYVEAFCEIMGYSPGDYFFIGDDPFGPVTIGDEFWNMSDIQYVISKYDKWKEKYGESLSDVIMDWYWYASKIHELNYKILEDRHWKKTAEEEPGQNQDVIICFADGDVLRAVYHHGEFHDIWEDGCTYKTPDYWKPINFNEEEYKPINLRSWLMGLRPDMDKNMEAQS